MFLSFEGPVSFPGDSGALGVVSRVKSFFSLKCISSQCFVFFWYVTDKDVNSWFAYWYNKEANFNVF